MANPILVVGDSKAPITIPREVVFELHPTDPNILLEIHYIKNTYDLPEDYVHPDSMTKADLLLEDKMVFPQQVGKLTSRINGRNKKIAQLNTEIAVHQAEIDRLNFFKTKLDELKASVE
jgi:hypothetical protein